MTQTAEKSYNDMTHKCNRSWDCKSETCSHAKDHNPMGCNTQAPCGSWPGIPDFKPMVICVPSEDVKPPDDCPNCGEKEASGHHPGNCIGNLKRQLARYQ